MIRPATLEDIPVLRALGRELYDETRFARLPFNEERGEATFALLIDGGFQGCPGCLFLAVEDGEIVGWIAGAVAPLWFSDATYAADLTLFVRREKRGGLAAAQLVRAFVGWAAEQGASEVMLGLATEVHADRTGELYERLGLRRIGGVYLKELG